MFCASPTYRKRRRAKLLRRSRLGVQARERQRTQSLREAPGWRRVATVILTVDAAPDGRHIEIEAHGGSGSWRRCGSERAVRGALTRMLWEGRLCKSQ